MAERTKQDPPVELTAVRVDKWLWAVRLFPTRTAATEACAAGRVEVDGERVKPARPLSVGDTVVVKGRPRPATCRVERLIEKRVGAPVATACYTDLTPESEESPAEDQPWWDSLPAIARRDRGAGRPTKKERRQLDRFRPER
jgi:ribosome-associated heat shock protein Hsp15